MRYANEQQWNTMRNEVAARVIGQISTKAALESLVKESGLDEMDFLYPFYQRKFVDINDMRWSFEEEKLRALVGLIGLCIERFYSIRLPIPRKLLGEESFGLRDYTIDQAGPWMYKGVMKWDEKFSRYGKEMKDAANSDYVPEDVEGFGLREDLKAEFSELFFDHIKKLISQPLDQVLEALKRNQVLRKLITEVSGYTFELKSFLADEYPKFKADFAPADAFGRLCLEVLWDLLWAGEFDKEKLRKGALDCYWSELESAVKDIEARKIIDVIRGEVTALVQ